MKALLLLSILLIFTSLLGCVPKPLPNQPPVALFALDWIDNFVLELDASLSYDPDGQVVLYTWDFGDGTEAASPFPSAYHSYQPGTYLISLKVTDEKGSSTSFEKDIVIVAEKTLSFTTMIKEAAGTLPSWPSVPVSPLEFVIRTQAEWERLLQHFPHPPTLPIIDFSKEIVIFVFLGERNNANYSVEFTRMIAAGGKLTVHYQEIEPGSRCAILPLISYPFHIVKTERVDLPALFVKEYKVKQC